MSQQHPFPDDITTPEGQQAFTQWLLANAQANLKVELAKLEAAGLLKDGVWTLPDETPKDMQDDSETSVVTG
jgi:hypothetical protein